MQDLKSLLGLKKIRKLNYKKDYHLKPSIKLGGLLKSIILNGI